MNVRTRIVKMVALSVVVTLPLLGMAGMASAASSPSGLPKITVQIDPRPLVETGASYILATIQVETAAAFANDPVNISSSQLVASCATTDFFNLQAAGTTNVTVYLDADGNATVLVAGEGCAPGSDLIEASLVKAPYITAVKTLVAKPPVTTPHGLFGYPTTSGTVTTGEVETGNSTLSGDSDVYAVFYVETNPVFAEHTVEIASAQLEGRCGGGWIWSSLTGGPKPGSGTVTGIGVNMGKPAKAILDDDGNAVFFFEGVSCAAGPSLVISGGRSTTFNINPPQPTI
jgi:hypothetical protein